MAMKIRILMLCILMGLSPAMSAENFPSRPITIINPFPPGGPLDFILRTIQTKMEADLGQSIIIENRPGATGNVGNAYVAKGPADGYVLLAQATNVGMFPHVFPNLPYDPIKDLAVVGALAETPGVCIVSPSAKYQSLADIIKEAKANPGKLNYGSTGNGSPSQIESELLAKANGVKFTHVPYKGASLVFTDLMGKFIDFSCIAVAGPLPLIRDGKLKALAMMTDKRSELLPDVPTVKELGLGDINESSRYILMAPAATPKPVLDRLSSVLAKALADPAVQDTYIKGGFIASRSTPDDVRKQIQEQYAMGSFVKDLNLGSQ
jgi:tripartite-type tricarboxylate transporter receptor subunit TctC